MSLMDLEYYTGQRIFLGFLGEYEPDGLVAGEPCGGCGWKEAQRGLGIRCGRNF